MTRPNLGQEQYISFKRALHFGTFHWSRTVMNFLLTYLLHGAESFLRS